MCANRARIGDRLHTGPYLHRDHRQHLVVTLSRRNVGHKLISNTLDITSQRATARRYRCFLHSAKGFQKSGAIRFFLSADLPAMVAPRALCCCSQFFDITFFFFLSFPPPSFGCTGCERKGLPSIIAPSSQSRALRCRRLATVLATRGDRTRLRAWMEVTRPTAAWFSVRVYLSFAKNKA